MSIPAGDFGQIGPPGPTAHDWASAVEATAARIVAVFEKQPAIPQVRTIEAATTVWETIYGHLRGRIPYPVPPDLMGVSVSAGTRILKGIAYTGTAYLQNGMMNDIADLRPWNGFLIPERIVLARYRQRTA